jgi:hypothetical protein
LATVFSLGSLGRVSDILTFYYQWASLVACNLPGFIEKLRILAEY